MIYSPPGPRTPSVLGVPRRSATVLAPSCSVMFRRVPSFSVIFRQFPSVSVLFWSIKGFPFRVFLVIFRRFPSLSVSFRRLHVIFRRFPSSSSPVSVVFRRSVVLCRLSHFPTLLTFDLHCLTVTSVRNDCCPYSVHSLSGE